MAGRIQIAVVGDVTADWYRVENPRYRLRQEGTAPPRTKVWQLPDSSVRMFAIPGGAWLLGQIIAEAVSGSSGQTHDGDIEVISYKQEMTSLEGTPRTIKTASANELIYSLAELSLFPRDPDGAAKPGEKDRSVYRIKEPPRYCGPNDASEFRGIPLEPNRPIHKEASQIIVVEEQGIGHHDDEVLKFLKSSEIRNDAFLVFKLSSFLPKSRDGLMSRQAGAANPIWEYVAQRFKDRLIVVVACESLRTLGLDISRGLSWERTATDFVKLLQDARLGGLKECRHLILRISVSGAIHCSRTSQDSESLDKFELFYDPANIEGSYYDRKHDGTMMGFNSLFVAWIIRHLCLAMHAGPKGGPDLAAVSQAVDAGISGAIGLCRALYRRSMGQYVETIQRFETTIENFQKWRNKNPPRDIGSNKFSEWFVELGKGKISAAQTYKSFEAWMEESKRKMVVIPAEMKIIRRWMRKAGYRPAKVPKSYKLTRDIFDEAEADPGAKQPWGRIEVPAEVSEHKDWNIIAKKISAAEMESKGLEIQKRGFHGGNLGVPYARYGGLNVVHRSEIEGYRSIHDLIGSYIREVNVPRPLSIAVFGPPGSGKSFGVTEIAKSFKNANIRSIQYNLSQFRPGGDELELAFLKIRGTTQGGEIPLVFFDEFDAEDFKFLVHFLEPMQDGRFKHGETYYEIGKAIFVFAGGICHNYEMFFEKIPKPDKGQPDTKKMHDFKSRLRGFVDIAGPNKVDDEDIAWKIRRAILFRSILQRKHLRYLLPQADGEANIDEDVLRAFLNVEEFSHGTRSMEAVLEMCIVPRGQRLDKSCLPPDSQMELHVNPEKFTECLNARAKLS